MTNTKYPTCEMIKVTTVQPSAFQIEPVAKKVESATTNDAVVIPTRNCGKFIVFQGRPGASTTATTTLAHLPHTNVFTLSMVAQVAMDQKCAHA
ncbi:hypothetical protein [Mesorhizobium mediterraneum]|uniref:hypothetical protein n=1 Tax=Mesorhizobium mediterraneum TaxID=43617 RepID=UPI001FED8891|nr:hypothetical protein [Mesorhizobium mediterraneum]